MLFKQCYNNDWWKLQQSRTLELFICRVEETVKYQERAFANTTGFFFLTFSPPLLCEVFFAVVGPSAAELSE